MTGSWLRPPPLRAAPPLPLRAGTLSPSLCPPTLWAGAGQAAVPAYYAPAPPRVCASMVQATAAAARWRQARPGMAMSRRPADGSLSCAPWLRFSVCTAARPAMTSSGARARAAATGAAPSLGADRSAGALAWRVAAGGIAVTARSRVAGAVAFGASGTDSSSAPSSITRVTRLTLSTRAAASAPVATATASGRACQSTEAARPAATSSHKLPRAAPRAVRLAELWASVPRRGCRHTKP